MSEAEAVIAETVEWASSYYDNRGDGLDSLEPKETAKHVVSDLLEAGYVIMPIEPTEKMLGAVYGRCGEFDGSSDPAREYYAALISAAARGGES